MVRVKEFQENFHHRIFSIPRQAAGKDKTETKESLQLFTLINIKNAEMSGCKKQDRPPYNI